MGSMKPTSQSANGEVRIVDSSNFTIAEKIPAAMVTIKPGGIREITGIRTQASGCTG